MDQMTVWKTCDCYSDTVREVLTPEEIEDGNKVAEINLTKILSDRCNTVIIPNPT